MGIVAPIPPNSGSTTSVSDTQLTPGLADGGEQHTAVSAGRNPIAGMPAAQIGQSPTGSRIGTNASTARHVRWGQAGFGNPCSGEGGCGGSGSPQARSVSGAARVAPGAFGFMPSGGVKGKCACDSGFAWQKQGEHPCGCTRRSTNQSRTQSSLYLNAPPNPGSHAATGKLASAAATGECHQDCCCVHGVCVQGNFTVRDNPLGLPQAALDFEVWAIIDWKNSPGGAGTLDWDEYPAGTMRRPVGYPRFNPWDWNSASGNDHWMYHGPPPYESGAGWLWKDWMENKREGIWKFTDRMSFANGQEVAIYIRFKSGCGIVESQCQECCILGAFRHQVVPALAGITLIGGRVAMHCGTLGSCRRPAVVEHWAGGSIHVQLSTAAVLEAFQRLHPDSTTVTWSPGGAPTERSCKF